MHRSCPVCSHSEVHRLYANRMAVLDGLDMSYTVGSCSVCGFYYADQLPDSTVYERYYRAASKYDLGVAVSGVDQVRFRAAVEICEAQFAKDSLIVDIGCGYGAFLNALSEAGWSRLAGVDPAPQAPIRALELFGLDSVQCATMARAHLSAPLADADVVSVMAVLEHLPQLRQNMADLLVKLRPGCKLLVEVPAVEWFASDRSEPFGEFSLEHIQFFTARSLCNFFEQLGARTMHVSTVELPAIHCGTLFGVFEWSGHLQPLHEVVPDTGHLLETYVRDAHSTMQRALSRVPPSPLVVYGAGSHTARLLPQLGSPSACEVLAVVDKNPNLVGKTLGQWVIQEPATLQGYPEVPVVISSYRAQAEISRQLSAQWDNPLILLYETPE